MNPLRTRTPALEVELGSNLDGATRLRVTGPRLDHRGDLTEVRASAEVTIWRSKVCVVEGVVCLQAELDKAWAVLSSQRKVFVQLDVGIVKSGAMEEVSLHVSEGPDLLGGKDAVIEPVISRCPRIEAGDTEGGGVWRIRTGIIAELVSVERVVYAGFGDGHGKAGLHCRDAGNVPATERITDIPVVVHAAQQWHLIVVQGHDAMARIVV